MMYYIYALGDPRTGNLYYVGCTYDPMQRSRQHLCFGYGHTKSVVTGEVPTNVSAYEQKNRRIVHSDNWPWRSKSPVFVVLERTTKVSQEAVWIARLKVLGHRLVNGNNGNGNRRQSRLPRQPRDFRR